MRTRNNQHTEVHDAEVLGTNGKQRGNALPPQDVSAFCLQLALLTEAGIPFTDGLEVMLEDAEDSRERELLTNLRDRTEDRVAFSQALEESGRFPAYMVHMVRIGESTGASDKILRELSVYYEREAETRKAVTGALTYPVLMIAVMLGVLFLLTALVMPVFEGVFAQLGAGFTPTTQALIQGVGIFSGVCLGLLAAVGIAAGVLRLTGRWGFITRLWGRLTGNRRLTALLDTGRLASVLALCLKSGLTVNDGMDMALPLLRSSRVRASAETCAQKMADGMGYPEALKETKLFTAMHRQMLQVGTRSGLLDEAMERVARESSDAAEERIAGIVARMEPALVAVLSLVAGGILLLVMLPLVGILTSLG